MYEKTLILYIEDNPDNQRLISRVLEARGYQVLLANDGPAGIAIASTTALNLVLIDMNIPTLDGYETTTRLRSMPHLRATPIIALTADVRPGTRERTLAAGCDGYLSKPIDPRAFPLQIQEFITGKREHLPPEQETSMLREYSQKLVQRLEEQVREVNEANRELQKLDQLKNQFIATISHELRTPLTAILGYIELFERGTLGPLQPLQQEALQVLTRNARQLGNQLNSLLYFQQVRANEVKRAPFLPHELVRRVVGDLQHQADDNGVTVRVQLQPSSIYQGDAPGIEHAMRQVLDNAIKFTARNGQVLVALQEDEQAFHINVRDTGTGIPSHALERVFEPFFQVDTSLALSQNGVGIGLSIVKHIIEAHGGTVHLRSEIGKGTLVQITLPK